MNSIPDSALLNHFQSFAPSNTPNQNTFPHVPTSNNYAPETLPIPPATQHLLSQAPQYSAQHTAPNQNWDSLQQQISQQQNSINQLASSFNHLIQTLSTNSTPQLQTQQTKLADSTPNNSTLYFSDDLDVSNAWKLTCNSKSDPSLTRKKIILSAKELNLNLPQEAKAWAQENNISVDSETESKPFNTSVSLSDSDYSLLSNASNLLSCLSDSEDAITIYSLVKKNLSHLPKESLHQVLADFSNQPSPQTLSQPSAVLPPPPVVTTEASNIIQPTLETPPETLKPSLPQWALDYEIELTPPVSQTQLSQPPQQTEEDDSSNSSDQSDPSLQTHNLDKTSDPLYITSKSLAHRKYPSPTDEQIDEIYSLLKQAKSSFSKSSTN